MPLHKTLQGCIVVHLSFISNNDSAQYSIQCNFLHIGCFLTCGCSQTNDLIRASIRINTNYESLKKTTILHLSPTPSFYGLKNASAYPEKVYVARAYIVLTLYFSIKKHLFPLFQEHLRSF